MHRRTLIAGAAIATLTRGVTMSDTASAQTKSDPENTLYMDLKQGRVVIQLFPDLAPKHVERVKQLAREGFYDNTPFHRVIEGFMAQGGDPTGTGTHGSNLPDLPAEFTTKRHFLRGTVGAARTSDPNSANSQFYIMFAPAPHLDGQYTIWGQVIQGMEFVDQIKRGSGSSGSVQNPDRIGTHAGRCRCKGLKPAASARLLTADGASRSKAGGEPVAQVVEHETFNLGVVGSSPTGLTKSEALGVHRGSKAGQVPSRPHAAPQGSRPARTPTVPTSRNGQREGRTDRGGCLPSPSRPGTHRAARAGCSPRAPARAATPSD